MSERFLFDTSAVSHVLDKSTNNAELMERFKDAVVGERAHVSDLTVHEIRRGLRKLELRGEGKHKIARTEQFLFELNHVALDKPVLAVATELWAQGQVHKPAINFSDADLLIAATAISNGMVLVTTDLGLGQNIRTVEPQTSIEVFGPDETGV